MSARKPKPLAVDLFAGCGGLSLGLRQAGYRVAAAVEFENLAASIYRKNHPRTKLYERDIRQIDPKQLLSDLDLAAGELTLLAGCPPCQGFSRMKTRNGGRDIEDKNNELVFEFVRFAEVLRPTWVMLENVPALAKDQRILEVTRRLSDAGYNVDKKVFDAQNFGAPQRRRRMILIGGLYREPCFAEERSKRRTVRATIGRLEAPSVSSDEFHNYSTRMSDRVKRLIENLPKDGGSRSDLPKEFQLACHRDCDGYKDVYGRMSWRAPAPTMTGGCINPSKGRFIHPEQNRPITLREAAMLQGFPRNYKLSMEKGKYPLALAIGNAFPPAFARAHAENLLEQMS